MLIGCQKGQFNDKEIKFYWLRSYFMCVADFNDLEQY